ncbi:small ribosomal subunit protein bS21c [Cryptomeria japonica]|uniref:small ribosomal subunit protein bS21c n=1 Tax=Cryptomeria japonica TaxID=3369 RepID=UPI0025AC9190|nr:small ribosomal subunit protein bS21c [Cryptomeria japonica]
MRLSPLPITTKARLPNFCSSFSTSHSKIKSFVSSSTSIYTPTEKPIYTDTDDINGQNLGLGLSSTGNSGSVIPIVRSRRGINAEIFVGPDESDESIVKRFRKAMWNSGAFGEMRRRRFYENKQDIRKRKIQVAKKTKNARRMLLKSVEKDDGTDEGQDDNDEEEEEEEGDNWNMLNAEIGL